MLVHAHVLNKHTATVSRDGQSLTTYPGHFFITTMSSSLGAFTQDPYMTHEEPTHEPLNLLPPQVVKPVPRLSRLSFDIIECIKHSRHQDGVFKVTAEIGGRRQDAILKLARN
jgi:hypothetical protein